MNDVYNGQLRQITKYDSNKFLQNWNVPIGEIFTVKFGEYDSITMVFNKEFEYRSGGTTKTFHTDNDFIERVSIPFNTTITIKEYVNQQTRK